jgi:hypothetical protein
MIGLKRISLRFIVTSGSILTTIVSLAQTTLPQIDVIERRNKVVVSWKNDYKKPVKDILIQRSFDSLNHFTTIGTVLNPMNIENGFPDDRAPYNRMFYRVTVLFEGGAYDIGKPVRPLMEPLELEALDITYYPPEISKPTDVAIMKPEINKPYSGSKPIAINDKTKTIPTDTLSKFKMDIPPIRIIETSYPSANIFTSKQNIVVIQIADAKYKKYQVKFFDEKEKLIFELKKIQEDYLMIEKSNFIHAGWFRFEIYQDGVLFEKNKVLIAKDKVK